MRRIAFITILLLIFSALAACCRQDSDCSNGIFCDGEELCVNLRCVVGTPPDCNDDVGCTKDTCNEPLKSCMHIPDDAVCRDDVYCNGLEYCDEISDCQPGTPVNCDDGHSCTHDSCNEETDVCDNTSDDSLCDDGAWCNGAEFCDPTRDCQPAALVACDDEILCTIDSCDEVNDTCSNVPDDALCTDPNFCTINERCDVSVGDCVSDPVDCSDGVDCTADSCREDLDTCVNEPQNDLCADENECTQDVCNPVAGCLNPNEPDGTSCTPFDGTTVCVDGTCVARGCGDGYVEPLDSTAGVEECDDGNTDDSDGCTILCRSQDFQANTTEEGEEKNPAAAVLEDGSFVIVFEDETYTSPSYTDVRLRLYDHRGNPISLDDEILSMGGSGIQIAPAVAALPRGGFAAVWADSAGSGDLFDVKLRLFDPYGEGSTTVTVNTSLFGSQLSPFVLASTAGILILWEDQATLSGEIKLRAFDLSGHPVDTQEITLPTGAMMYLGEPAAAKAPDGSFLATWTGSSDGLDTALYGRIFDEAAVPVSDVIEISSTACYQNYTPAAAWYGDPGTGVFVVAWERICSGSTYPEIAAAVIDPADPGPTHDPLTISPPTEENFSPVVTASRLLAVPGGSSEPPAERWIAAFVWAGTSTTTEPTDAPYDILGQRYTVEGALLVPFDPAAAVLTTTTRFEQSNPAGAMNPSGDFVITWTDYSREGSDASYSSVRARYLPNGWFAQGPEY